MNSKTISAHCQTMAVEKIRVGFDQHVGDHYPFTRHLPRVPSTRLR